MGIELALTPTSGHYTMEGYLYNRFPDEMDEESKDALRVEPTTAPSLIHEGLKFPVNSENWKLMQERNSSPETLYPAIVMGVEELEARQSHQMNQYLDSNSRMTKMVTLFKDESKQAKIYNEKAIKRLTRKLKKVRRVTAAVRGLIEGRFKEEFDHQGTLLSSNVSQLTLGSQYLLEANDHISDDVKILGEMDKEARIRTYQKLREQIFTILKEKMEKREDKNSFQTLKVLEESLLSLESVKAEEVKIKGDSERVVELAKRLAQLSL